MTDNPLTISLGVPVAYVKLLIRSEGDYFGQIDREYNEHLSSKTGLSNKLKLSKKQNGSFLLLFYFVF